MEDPTNGNTKMNSKNLKIVICGTDTDVGKTIVSSLLVQGLHAKYWKPIQSGLNEGGDTQTVIKLLNLGKERIIPEIYRFKHPVSPHWAARKENIYINPLKLNPPEIVSCPLIIETAGGLMVPLNDECLQIDILKKWMLPIILVARSGLGTLNHTILSVEALRKRNIPIMGLILNGDLHKNNPQTLKRITGLPVIAELPFIKDINSSKLKDFWINKQIKKFFLDY